MIKMEVDFIKTLIIIRMNKNFSKIQKILKKIYKMRMMIKIMSKSRNSSKIKMTILMKMIEVSKISKFLLVKKQYLDRSKF